MPATPPPPSATRKRGRPSEAALQSRTGLLALMLVTAAVLVMALPVLISSGTGKVSGVAEAIAGIFAGSE